MILLDVIVVALSNIPYGMFLIHVATNVTNRRFTAIETLLIVLAQLISAIQVFGSFYFYLIVSSAFRNNVKKMLCNFICFWIPRITHQIAPSVQGTNTQPIATAPMVSMSTKIPNVVN